MGEKTAVLGVAAGTMIREVARKMVIRGVMMGTMVPRAGSEPSKATNGGLEAAAPCLVHQLWFEELSGPLVS